MENTTEVRYQTLAEKMLELVKGENYDDVLKAIKSMKLSLRRKSIVN